MTERVEPSWVAGAGGMSGETSSDDGASMLLHQTSNLQDLFASINFDYNNIRVDKLTLRYKLGDETYTELDQSYNASKARRYRQFLRVTTIMFLFVNLALIPYDFSRFESKTLLAVLALRLAVLAPICLGIVAWTYSKWYINNAQVVAVAAFALGGVIVAYSVVGKDPGYGTLALLIVYLFSFTPVHSWRSAAVSFFLVLAFAVCLLIVPGLDIKTSERLDVIGVLFLFLLMITFVGHMLEFSLRMSFLEEYVLISDRSNIQKQKSKSDNLLQAMLPPAVVNSLLSDGGRRLAEEFDEVTVLFCELVNFTTFASRHSPVVVVQALNHIYTAFDALVDRHAVYKVETVGEVYMAVAGCPERSRTHAEAACQMALAMMSCMQDVLCDLESFLSVDVSDLTIRIGLNSGPIVAGIVGQKNPRYKLFGDTVNTASRMESTCEPGRIQMSESCYISLHAGSIYPYRTTARGGIFVKGKGDNVPTWWLEGVDMESFRSAGLLVDARESAPGSSSPPPLLPSQGEPLRAPHTPSGPYPGERVVSASGVNPSTSTPLGPTGQGYLKESAGLKPGRWIPSSSGRMSREQSSDGVKRAPRREAKKSLNHDALQKLAKAAKSGRIRSARPSGSSFGPSLTSAGALATSTVGAPPMFAEARSASVAPSAENSPRATDDPNDLLTGGALSMLIGRQRRPRRMDSGMGRSIGSDVAGDAVHQMVVEDETDAKALERVYLGTQSNLFRASTPRVPPDSARSRPGEFRGDGNLSSACGSPSPGRPRSGERRRRNRRRRSATGAAKVHTEHRARSDSKGGPSARLSDGVKTSRWSGVEERKDSAPEVVGHLQTAPGPSDSEEDALAAPQSPPRRRSIVRFSSKPVSEVVTIPIRPEAEDGEETAEDLGAKEQLRRIYRRAQHTLVCLHHLPMNLSRQLDAEARASLINSEVAYQRYRRPSNWRFLRMSIGLCILALGMFFIQDFTKYDVDDETEANRWKHIALVRYGIMWPVCFVYLLVSYSRKFKSHQAFAQAITVVTLFLLGLGLVAISVIGGDPGFGVLALFIVYAMNISAVAPFYRVAVLTIIVACYLGAIRVFNTSENRGDIGFNDLLTHGAYLLIFLVGITFPVLAREDNDRKLYLRQSWLREQKERLDEESMRANALLHNLLPPTIVHKLVSGERYIAEEFKLVTILFTDLRGFTDFASKISPRDLVAFLNTMYSHFDYITDRHGLYKVEIIGDAYFVVGGCPEAADDHLERCCAAALEMLEFMPLLAQAAGCDITMRVGVHCGPVVAGIVGTKDPRYHLFGETVNYAMLMESHGEPGKVHISKEARNHLLSRQRPSAPTPEPEILSLTSEHLSPPSNSVRTQSLTSPKSGHWNRSPTRAVGTHSEPVVRLPLADLPMFTCRSRGLIDVKGHGKRETYFLGVEGPN